MAGEFVVQEVGASKCRMMRVSGRYSKRVRRIACAEACVLPAVARRQCVPPHTEQLLLRAILMLFHSIARASSSNNLPASEVLMPANSFKASAACMLPIMPTNGANTHKIGRAHV